MKLHETLSLGLRSLLLDWHLFTCRYPVTFLGKCEFILKKDVTIIKHHFLNIPLILSTSNVSLASEVFYYGSTYGMAVFQTMIVTLSRHIVPYLETLSEPIIVDVGAHLGFFSLPLASLLHHPRIYAVEPVSNTFHLLEKNTQNMTSIKAFRLGLWNKKGNMNIYSNPHLLMYSSLFPERFTWDKHPHQESVRLTTLDSFCKENNINSIDLLKVDAEGAEEKILRGGSRMLSRTHYIFIECPLDQIDHSTFTSLMSTLVGKHYNFQLVKITSTMEHQGNLMLVNMLFKNTFIQPAVTGLKQ